MENTFNAAQKVVQEFVGSTGIISNDRLIKLAISKLRKEQLFVSITMTDMGIEIKTSVSGAFIVEDNADYEVDEFKLIKLLGLLIQEF